MSLTLKVEHPDFPDGWEFGVNDLGRVKNHGTLEIDEDMERSFVSARGMPLVDAFKDNATLSLSGNSSLSADDLKELIPEQPAEVEEQPTTQSNTTTTFAGTQNEGTTTDQPPEQESGER